MITNSGSCGLHATTIAIDDPGKLTDFIGADDQAFMHGQDGFVAIGEVARLETSAIAEADAWWQAKLASIQNVTELPDCFGIGPLVVGSFVFDPAATQQKSVLIIPETIIGRRGGRSWLTRISSDQLRPSLPETTGSPQAPRRLRFTPGSLDRQAWMRRVQQAMSMIQAGAAEKVVLARDLLAVAAEPVDLRWAFGWLAEAYSGCWSYLVDGLVGSTPEMIIRRADGMTLSRVLAGTIQRLDTVSDIELAARLQASAKDLEEHRMAAESVIKALSGYLRGMHTPDAPFVLTLPNVMHLATDVCGVSDPGLSTLFLAGQVHPTAAVCGTPTEVARQIIADSEGMDRGRFAGIVGWMDARGDGEWALALRCGRLEADRRQVRLFAGAGIVAGSNPADEWLETEAKLAPMKNALSGADRAG